MSSHDRTIKWQEKMPDIIADVRHLIICQKVNHKKLW